MTDDEIRAFVSLADAATPGPWTTHDDPGCGETCECGEECGRVDYAVVRASGGSGVATVLVGDRDAFSARFIAASRTAAPALADEVLRLREAARERDEARAEVTKLRAVAAAARSLTSLDWRHMLADENASLDVAADVDRLEDALKALDGDKT